ncbi:Uncharacterized protein OS=uncultured bacterium PE=4 SV=1 [Gemmata massiliana]|uniref:SMI1/KNR4 family protein n=1 Tax=Gemmata massiliana TaxID=1210884 RepID=A0A6P2CT73_9BACT|nr:hypothetical protein [Gemmata massiliana]VTR92139.1 Uncharacterized protein OS=uncultured bacterium PE=4 SV=1 [Gemmata massiliana]
MTEAEWLACKDPATILEFLDGKASDRKLRLFAVACCRYFFFDPHGGDIQAEDFILDPTGWFVDGVFGEREREIAEAQARDLHGYGFYAANKREALIAVASAAFSVLRVWWALEHFSESQGCYGDELHVKGCEYLRCVFNPFRPVPVVSSWLTSTVLTLAEGIYQEHAFDRMPILADALQDAGCDSDGLLNHLRSDGPHVRGCWVVDTLLGKG